MYSWPTHFPDQCPPSEASEISGIVFRLISKEDPIEFDFQSHYERAPSGNWPGMECASRGLSVFKSYEDCKVLQDAVPALRKKFIANATLGAGAGLIKETPSRNCNGHCTWWRSITAEEARALFVAVGVSPGGAS